MDQHKCWTQATREAFPSVVENFDLDTDANIYIPHKNRNLVLKLLAAPPSNDE